MHAFFPRLYLDSLILSNLFILVSVEADPDPILGTQFVYFGYFRVVNPPPGVSVDNLKEAHSDSGRMCQYLHTGTNPLSESNHRPWGQQRYLPRSYSLMLKFEYSQGKIIKKRKIL